MAFGASAAQRQEGDGPAGAVAALVVVLRLGLQQHRMDVMQTAGKLLAGDVHVVVDVAHVIVIVIVGRRRREAQAVLVVVVFAEEVAVVSEGKLVAGHQLALAQGTPEALDVVDLALGPHHEIRPAET